MKLLSDIIYKVRLEQVIGRASRFCSHKDLEKEKRNVKVLALSVDGVESHKTWINDINETQHVQVGFPIIADEDKAICHLSFP